MELFTTLDTFNSSGNYYVRNEEKFQQILIHDVYQSRDSIHVYCDI